MKSLFDVLENRSFREVTLSKRARSEIEKKKALEEWQTGANEFHTKLLILLIKFFFFTKEKEEVSLKLSKTFAKS